jgi:hypothetical protein
MRSVRALVYPVIAALIASAATVVGGAAAVAADTNILLNGTFGAPGNPNPASWSWHALTMPENCCDNPSAPHARSWPNGAGGKISIKQDISNAPSGNYTLRGRIRTSGGVQQAWLRASSGGDGRYCETGKTNTTIWTTFSCTFTLSAAGPLRVVLLSANPAAAAGGWINYDDIALIHHSTGQPTTFDLAQYVVRTSANNGPVYQFNTQETMQVQYDSGTGRYYQTKNANWEEFSFTSSYMRRYRDISLSEQEWYGLYENGTLGSNWAPRNMSIGQTFNRNPEVRFYWKNSCTASRPWGHHPTTIKLEAHYPTLNINGYTLNDVILLIGYDGHNTTSRWEDFYYARGIGLVRFVAYNPPGSNIVGFEGQYNGPGGTAPSRGQVCTP